MPSKIRYRKVPKATTFESSDKMSQVLANLESRDPPENNDPPKEETLKQISLFGKKYWNDMLDILNKCHTDPMFIDNDYLTVRIHNS